MLRFIFVFLLLFAGSVPAWAATASPLPTAAATTTTSTTLTTTTVKSPIVKKDTAPQPVTKIEGASDTQGAGEVSSDDPYTVHGVKVDVTESTSMKARDKAFTIGQQTAFLALAKSLSGDEPVKMIDDVKLGKLIKSFEVETERASGTRYTATLTYHFKPQATAAVLGKGGDGVSEPTLQKKPDGIQALSATTMPPQRVLVLPILRAPERSILWEEKTPWHLAWANVMSDKPSQDLILPEGTIEDVGSITASEALAGLNLPLTRIMRKYQARGVIVAALLAGSNMPQSNQNLSIQLARFDEHGKMISTIVLPAPAQPNRKDMEWLQAGVTNSIAAWRDAVAKSQTQPAPVPQYGIQQPSMPASTTGAPATAAGQFLRVLLTVPFANMEEWNAKRETLQAIPGITAIEVQRMNRYRAVVQIDYTGAQSQLDQALSTRNMQIMPTNPPDGTYMLSSTGGPQVVNGATGQPVFTTVYSNGQPVQPVPPQGTQQIQMQPAQIQPVGQPQLIQDQQPVTTQDPNMQDRFEQQ